MITVPSSPVATASGSVGDKVFSHNQHGPYVRNRTTPTDRRTARQRVVRQRFQIIIMHWMTILTETQRRGWRTYAEAIPIKNALGQVHHITPLQMFVRCNLARTHQFLMLVKDAPTIFNNGNSGVMDVTNVIQLPQSYVITFDDTAEWTTELGSALLLWQASGRSPTVHFYKGPFKAAQQILGNPDFPPTSPTTVPSILINSLTARVFIRMLVTRADGRLGKATIANAIVQRLP